MMFREERLQRKDSMKKHVKRSFGLLAACLLALGSVLALPALSSYAQVSTPSGASHSNATTPSFDQSLIDEAVSQNLFSYPAPTSASPRPGDAPAEVFASKAIYFMALVTWYNPNA